MKNRNNPILEVLRCKKPFSLILPVLLLALVTAIANADLVANYEFEGNANDSVGGIVGTLKGNAQIINDPEMGLVLWVDGNGDYVNSGSPFASVGASATKSIMAWTKSFISDYSGQGAIFELYSRSDSSLACSIKARGDPATWRAVYGKGSTAELDSGVSVSVNKWTHVAFVQDGADVSIYINGRLEDSANNAIVPGVSNPINASIGAYVWYSQQWSYFNGLIDDVRIYDHALSEAEIRAIVPEPATLCLLMMGAVIALRQRRRT